MSRLYSIGYADHTPESLVSLLKESGVEVVADVRANPVSRKKGFSRNRLAEVLSAADIEYRSVRELGIPASDRKAVIGGASGWDRLLADYAASLDETDTRGPAAEGFAENCKQAVTAVMCLESDLAHCHRKPLSEWVAAKAGLELAHL